LLDVDGVIALMGDDRADAVFETVVAGFPVTIAIRTPERLARLTAAFQLVWATSWQREAAESLGPVLGLSHELPWLPFDPEADRDAWTYKLPTISRFVRDSPAAIVDDELGEDVTAWANQRPFPTLIVQPDPRVGLTDNQVDELLRFVSDLERDSL
jgi:hypothetical protein